MFIKNLSKREKLLLIVTLSIGCVVGIYVMIIEPIGIRWKMLDEQTESKVAQIIKDKTLLSAYKEMEKEYAKYQDLIQGSKNEEEELAKALGEIEAISKTSSCRILNVKSLSSKSVADYKEISFEVTAEGSIVEISQFLYAIETSAKCLRVRHFTISAKSGAGANLKAVFHIAKIILP